MISTSPIHAKAVPEVPVGMGQSVFACDPARLSTILGSCVAVTLYSPQRRLGMLSHVVLPQAKGSTSNPAKFADTAVPHMLSTLKQQGVGPRDLRAKIVGGACMFGFGGGACAQIGENNVQAVTEALQQAGIPIAGRNVNGNKGRRVSFDLSTGCITVTSVGQPSQII